MLFVNTFEVLSWPLARKITKIGLDSVKIDVKTSEICVILGRILDTYDFPICQKNSRGDLSRRKKILFLKLPAEVFLFDIAMLLFNDLLVN